MAFCNGTNIPTDILAKQASLLFCLVTSEIATAAHRTPCYWLTERVEMLLRLQALRSGQETAAFVRAQLQKLVLTENTEA